MDTIQMMPGIALAALIIAAIFAALLLRALWRIGRK